MTKSLEQASFFSPNANMLKLPYYVLATKPLVRYLLFVWMIIATKQVNAGSLVTRVKMDATNKSSTSS